MSETIFDVFVERIRRSGLVIVPVVPTQLMLDAAKESAWAEDAEGVWRDMIAAIDYKMIVDASDGSDISGRRGAEWDVLSFRVIETEL